MLNRVILVGRLTKDPELKYTPNGVAVANFTLAVNRPFSNQQGEKETDFINCVVWRKPAENVANYLKKGSLAGIDGRLQTRSYENNQGQRVYITEVMAESVQFLEPKGGGQQQSKPQEPQKNSFNADPFANDGQPIDISDDDLPF
jgi:single-strand DNA-binding protein